MRTRYFLFFLIALLLTSCKQGVDISILNMTEKKIDSVIITNGFNNLKIENIEKGKKLIGFLSFKEETPNQDGEYNIKTLSKDKIMSRNFGYFSNGIPSSSKFEVIIKNDTILIKELFD